MNRELTAAIIGAVSAYIQQEELSKAFARIIPPRSAVNPWRLFGQQEMMRVRTNWRVTRTRR